MVDPPIISMEYGWWKAGERWRGAAGKNICRGLTGDIFLLKTLLFSSTVIKISLSSSTTIISLSSYATGASFTTGLPRVWCLTPAPLKALDNIWTDFFFSFARKNFLVTLCLTGVTLTTDPVAKQDGAASAQTASHL